jgi:hypothetical protein
MVSFRVGMVNNGCKRRVRLSSVIWRRLFYLWIYYLAALSVDRTTERQVDSVCGGSEDVSWSVSDVDRYVVIIKVTRLYFGRYIQHSYTGRNFKHYRGIFFRKVAYTRHDVVWFVKLMDFRIINGCVGGLFQGTIPAYVWWDREKPRWTYVRIDSILTEIRTIHLLNLNQKSYRLGQLG